LPDYAVSLGSAKALGIDVPVHLQQIADEVIEQTGVMSTCAFFAVAPGHSSCTVCQP
jgi:hypothetical protein